MKKILLILTFWGNCIYAVAQNCNTEYLGTKTLYGPPQQKQTAAPKGYQPVFINQAGRHGARHLTKEVNASFAYNILHRADSLHALTADGQKLWEMVQRLDKVEHGRVKSISAEGETELRDLGIRMYNNYHGVFKKPVRLNVGITKEIRTKQSSEAFLKGLKSRIKDSVSIKGYQDDVDLRFYDLSPTYTAFEEKGPWEPAMAALKKDQHLEDVQQHAVSRWLNPDLKLKHTDIGKLVSDVFGFATIVYSLQQEIRQSGYQFKNVDFSSLFTCDELKALGTIDAAEDYYKKGPGVDNNGIQVKIAAPLLANFIKSADAGLKNHTYNAELRFAHAETISPFAGIMEITEASKVAAEPRDISKNWKAGEIIPLSSNIQWIFYKSARSKNYLVKFLLNEREVKIGKLKPVSKCYYNWTSVRAYYMQKLKKLGLGLDSDMTRYLSDVK